MQAHTGLRYSRRQGVWKPLTGLHPAHSTMAGANPAGSMRCCAEHACWARRRRILSGYGSLSSSLRHRLSAYSLSWRGKRRDHNDEIALSGERERAATGATSTRYFRPSHLAEADVPPEFAPFPATMRVGCQASSGRFPQPLLMRANATYSVVGKIVTDR
jgi:hypothetical protein